MTLTSLIAFATGATLATVLPPEINEYTLLDTLLFSMVLASFGYTYIVDRNSCKKEDIKEDLAYIRSKIDVLYEHFLPDPPGKDDEK